MTQEELAFRAGLTRQTVAKAEKPGAVPSMRTQRRISEILGGGADAYWDAPTMREAA